MSSAFRRFLIVVSLLAAPIAAAGPGAAMAQGAVQQSFFNTHEVERNNLTPFPKWTGMLERHLRETRTIPGSCKPTPITRCRWEDWMHFLDSIRSRDFSAQMDAVNRYMNQHKYVLDIVNWAVEDYWATPYEFLRVDGDCEDFAIAKFISLRLLGHENAKMRIVVLQDLNLRIPHAVLIVSLNDRFWVLDNQIPQVVDATSIRHYRPIYSVDEKHWWLHKP